VHAKDIVPIHHFIGFLEEMMIKCRVAVLVKNPNQRVLSEMLSVFGSYSTMNFAIFSNLEDAVKYVGCPESSLLKYRENYKGKKIERLDGF